jgi:hypothetical protein
MRLQPTSVSYLPLERWYQQWALYDTHIRCKFCDTIQTYADATRPFMHQFHCPARGRFPQYPLRERHQLLREQMELGLS